MILSPGFFKNVTTKQVSRRIALLFFMLLFYNAVFAQDAAVILPAREITVRQYVF